MSWIIAIAAVTCAKGVDIPVGPARPAGYKSSLYLGTPCECNVSTISHAHIYDLEVADSLPAPRDGSSGCKANSENPLDLWNGRGLDFYDFYTMDGKGWGTFEFQIDCAHLCWITQVNVSGTAWCPHDFLYLYKYHEDDSRGGDSYNLRDELVADVNNVGPEYDELVMNGGTLYHEIVMNTPEETPNTSPWAKTFRLMETTTTCGPTNGGGDVTIALVDEWRCRSGLSIMATTAAGVPAECGGVCGGASITSTTDSPTASPTTSTTASTTDSSDDSSNGSSDDATTTSTTDSNRNSDSSSDDSSESSNGGSSENSSADSSEDSDDQPTHCHSDSECRGSQICDEDVFECVDPSSDSSADSSEDSSDESSKDLSKDSSKESSKESSSDSNDDSSADLSTVLLRYQQCSSRVKELEAWQETLLSMTSAKRVHSHEDGGEDKEGGEESHEDGNVGPLSPHSALDVFDVEEALIVCLVLTNVVLLAYACLCKSNVPKNKSIYAGVPSSEQENLCA